MTREDFIRNREVGWDTDFINLPFRSVDTPVANKPRDATANEPPRSTRACFSRVSRIECHTERSPTHACNGASMEDIQAVLNDIDVRDDV